METLLANGLVGGLVATIIMTIVQMRAGGDDPPPTAVLWSKYVGDEGPGAYMMQGMVLHFIYGTSAGGAFGVIAYLVDLDLADSLIGIGSGVGYGIVLFLIAAVFWMNMILKLDADRPQVIMFLIFHLVYGLVLGLWMTLEVFTL